jgi:hypothetical protein
MRADDLRFRAAEYLAAHHTMTLATVSPAAASETAPQHALPHAASVFYAVDSQMRLVFLSKPGSQHGENIGPEGRVAITVTEEYSDWQAIQGIQLWGAAVLLTGASRAAAFATYVTRFPFVRDMLKQANMEELFRGIGVYRVTAESLAFTDNTTGVFGREVLELGKPQT